MSVLVENDVRLIRRYLICLQWQKFGKAMRIYDYLVRERELNIITPAQQTSAQVEGYLNRLTDKEKWLARKFGCVLLPDYMDTIFLNSKWANPKTLYVRLLFPIPELGELGDLIWLPEEHREDWDQYAEKNHKAYLDLQAKLAKPAKVGLLDRIKGYFTNV